MDSLNRISTTIILGQVNNGLYPYCAIKVNMKFDLEIKYTKNLNYLL